MQRFRGGLVFKAHRLCVSLNSRLESDKEEEEDEIHAEGCRCSSWGGLDHKVLDRLGGVPRHQKMLKGHLPRVIHKYTKINTESDPASLVRASHTRPKPRTLQGYLAHKKQPLPRTLQ